jgi:hypothetical protein
MVALQLTDNNKISMIRNIYSTVVKAIDPVDGILKTWDGDKIKAISFGEAEYILQNTERGYMKVTSELVSKMPFKESTKENTYEADFDNLIDYSNYKLN